ncbi:MAG: Sec61p translocation complex subunit [Watsoniomyces obsoletus]|nr:MAG: Sec61p translocation complex subunit [Watsoniomyces obsoletus]
MEQKAQDILTALDELDESYEFSIIRLSAPLAVRKGDESTTEGSRASDVSNKSLDDAYPADLEAELAHYKELFSKLRFSYLEQVTKEKFIRAILNDPPLTVEHADIVALEGRLAGEKGALKAQKIEVDNLLSELESRGRDLSQRYEAVQLQSRQARDLPGMISELQQSIDELRSNQSENEDPSQSLPLPATLTLVSQRQSEISQLDRQIASLESTLARKDKELERLEWELRPLESQRQASQKAAEEAKRRKLGLDSDGNDLERRGRWWKGVHDGLHAMLELEA